MGSFRMTSGQFFLWVSFYLPLNSRIWPCVLFFWLLLYLPWHLRVRWASCSFFFFVSFSFFSLFFSFFGGGGGDGGVLVCLPIKLWDEMRMLLFLLRLLFTQNYGVRWLAFSSYDPSSLPMKLLLRWVGFSYYHFSSHPPSPFFLTSFPLKILGWEELSSSRGCPSSLADCLVAVCFSTCT